MELTGIAAVGRNRAIGPVRSAGGVSNRVTTGTPRAAITRAAT